MYDKDTVSGDGNAAHLAKLNKAKADAVRIDADQRRTVLAPSHQNPDKADAIKADARIRKANATYHRAELHRMMQPEARLSRRQIQRRRKP